MNAVQRKVLRVPPFPGARCKDFAAVRADQKELTEAETDFLIASMRTLKIGGVYWGTQPELPEAPYVLIRIADGSVREHALKEFGDSAAVLIVTGGEDPWHLVSGARSVLVDADDELALIAAVAGIEVRCIGEGVFAQLVSADRDVALRHVIRSQCAVGMLDPFTGEVLSLEAIVGLCGFWRQLIDSNRDIAGAAGFAFWKRATVAPLLWGGNDVNFIATANNLAPREKVAIWKSRTPTNLLRDLARTGSQIIEVEDGFIRSAGLGADCVPPLSIVVDRFGVHFDPRKPSELEDLIQNSDFDADLLGRARTLRELIVASGVSKYGAEGEVPLNRSPGRRRILVPGQVEDDRAVTCGGGGVVDGNLELLRRARADAPDAYIIYKPHPDIEAGHRVGAIAESDCLKFADEIVRGGSISRLLDAVDEVHVNSSLAGFEALLRSKPVTTHGVPFYAGWDLTRDLGDVPARRTAVRTIDELVAAVLLLYPRYLDPVTGLPCPPEILIRRIAEGGTKSRDGMIVHLRRLQGRLKKRLAGLGLAR